MNEVVEQLRAALVRVVEGKPVEARRKKDEPCLSPRGAWLLIYLVRVLGRQEWARRIIEERLNIAVPSRDSAGIVTNRLESADGIVPGMPEWEYEVYDVDARLENRVTGEIIDCPLVDPGWRKIDASDLAERFFSLREPDFPEARLKALHKFPESFAPTLRELCDFDAVASSGDVFYLLDDLARLNDVVAQLDKRWLDEGCRRQVAHAVEDWECLEDQSSGESANAVKHAAEAARRVRARRLSDERHNLFQAHFAGNLYAMYECESPDLHEWLVDVLSDEPCDVSFYQRDFCAAVQIADRLQDKEILAEVYGAFRRDCEERQRSIGERQVLVSVLLKQPQYKDEVLQAVLADDPSVFTAIVALEHRPEEARRLFAAALRSPDLCERLHAAEALAIIDEPWCRQELVAALHESSAYEEIVGIRAAIRKSLDHSIHVEADRWEARYQDKFAGEVDFDTEPLVISDREPYFTVEQLLSLRGRVA